MTDPSERRAIILVVDDTPESLSFLTETLDRVGMTVLVATDGQSALELLEQITPDLVLMDAVMPVMDGFEACRRIKRDKRLAHLPVIFMTGLSETEHVVEGLSAGGVDYVGKPLVLDELLARIRVHLANARVSNGAQAALDSTGRFLLSTDGQDRILWCTPKAAEVIGELFPVWPQDSQDLPPELAQRLGRLRRGGIGELPKLEIGDRRVDFSFLGRAGGDEYLFRLSETSLSGDIRMLQDRHGLTLREAEVLLWLSGGKANREISEILGISPRTVNKHLEQVFEKLGVENRASAAASAVRLLSQWG
jgi:DNA-binding NarL/FixJ family response regulator